MRLLMFLSALLVVQSFTNLKAQEKQNLSPQKDYFASFRKNELPQDYEFLSLNKFSEQNVQDYYVIYKEEDNESDFFFKVDFDSKGSPISTYYATDENKRLLPTTLDKLKLLGNTHLSQEQLKECESFYNSTVDHNRKKDCYSKSTVVEVWLCSLESQLESL